MKTPLQHRFWRDKRDIAKQRGFKYWRDVPPMLKPLIEQYVRFAYVLEVMAHETIDKGLSPPPQYSGLVKKLADLAKIIGLEVEVRKVDAAAQIAGIE